MKGKPRRKPKPAKPGNPAGTRKRNPIGRESQRPDNLAETYGKPKSGEDGNPLKLRIKKPDSRAEQNLSECRA